MYVKRDPYVCQKRPLCMSKETLMYVRRDPYVCQKRPLCMSKETLTYVKRDPYVCQKRPLCMKRRPMPETRIYIETIQPIAIGVSFLHSQFSIDDLVL